MQLPLGQTPAERCKEPVENRQGRLNASTGIPVRGRQAVNEALDTRRIRPTELAVLQVQVVLRCCRTPRLRIARGK